MIVSGLFDLLVNDPTIGPLLAPGGSVYFALAAKEAQRPYIVLHIVGAPPAAVTLDGTSPQIEGRLQFDSYADDLVTARKLSKAVRALLADYSGLLSDGTVLQTLEVVTDFDDAFEIGGVGYLFRVVLDLRIFYTESS